MSLKVKNVCLHQIDHSSSSIRLVKLANQSENIEKYSRQLFEDINNTRSRRLFTFAQKDSEVHSNVSKMIEGENFLDYATKNANRLLSVEQTTQSRLSHLIEIQKGVLFQSHIEIDEQSFIILCKSDQSEFIDEKDFSLRNGLPLKKRIYKSALAKISSNAISDDVSIFDSNPSYSKYWWEIYLELKEKFTDTYNTKTSLNIIDKKIFNKIKNRFPVDYAILRNSTIGYFRNKNAFDIHDFTKNIFESYVPENDNLKMEPIIDDIYKLPNKHNFDSQFLIAKEEIPKKKLTKIKLHDRIELRITGHCESLASIISNGTDAEGNNYIKILTDHVFD